MMFQNSWMKWWNGVLGTSRDRNLATMEILRQRYVEETQGKIQLTQHAYKMHYRQFREKLLQIATEKIKHAEWIGEKIIALGGAIPEVVPSRSTDENSWRHLLTDLAEEKRYADRLPEQLWRIASDHPEISKLLQRIFDAETVHRQSIRDMAMRSDGFALSLA